MNEAMNAIHKRGMGALPMIRKEKHGRGAHATLGVLVVVAFLAVFVGTGCHEPDYRTEVTGNGEGGVNIQRVPKDPSEMAAQQSPPPATKSPLEQRVEVLETTVLRQQEEIVNLRREVNARHSTTGAPQ